MILNLDNFRDIFGKTNQLGYFEKCYGSLIILKAYWVNNSINIWNSLTIMLGLKMEDGYMSTKLNLVRIYKNSILVKFHRKFEIEILDSNIIIKTFFQLQFMKKWASLENSSLDKMDNVVIELPTVERLLENVIKMFLQFDSEYWIMPVECMPI
jgi:hypothetical protein